MRAGNARFKLTWSTLWHLWMGGTRLVIDKTISILRVVLLLDVSKWQGVIDFVKMITAGAHGVILKCGQGMFKDIQFDFSWMRAKLAGIPRGSYWFYDSRVDPKVQAANWWNWIKADKGELMHFADYEENYLGAYKGWRSFKIFLQEFQRLSNLPSSKIGIYTGYYYWIANSPTTLAELNWFAQFPLWLAWYTNNPANVTIPRPWTSLILWQYGTPANGPKYGVESEEIDENNFNGDMLAYKTRFGLDGSVILPPVEPPPIVVEPPVRPDVTPEPRLWSAEVLAFYRMTVRTYPLRADDTVVRDESGASVKVYGGEMFKGVLWSGNDYVWIRIDQYPQRASLVGKWVAVRKTDGSEKFITLRTLNGGIPSPAPRPAGVFAVALHDYQTSEFYRRDWNYSVPRGLLNDRDNLKNDVGWPEMVPFDPREGVKLTEKLQWFWFKQLILSYYGHSDFNRLSAAQKDFIKEAWRGVTKGHTAFCNGKGTDTCWDYIRGVNEHAELPMLWENTCGGSLLELSSAVPYTRGYKVKTLKTADYELWKDWTFLDHPQFFSFGTNATPYLIGTTDTVTKSGPWKVDPMHYLDGKHLPIPIISDAGYVFVKTHRVRILQVTEPTPGPYRQ